MTIFVLTNIGISMDKKEFTKRVNKKLKEKGFSNKYEDSRDIVDIVIDEISDILEEGKSVYFQNLGKFDSVYRNFRIPSTGRMMATFVVTLKASNRLKKKLKKYV